jgi:RimJ/RimL family protein N-acetyltransferase
MNQDPEVMAFFVAPDLRVQSDAAIELWRAQIDEQGWSNWALELRASGEFIGFTGLSVPRRALPFSPCVEIGWRLSRQFWGHGYATEAARAALEAGLGRFALKEIVSYTSLLNVRSRAVMERIGMRDAKRDFDHPAIREGHPLRRHCLYRITREEWPR